MVTRYRGWEAVEVDVGEAVKIARGIEDVRYREDGEVGYLI